jgi:prepilin-type N-terminal cleavage/methylation domain-containing protein
MLRMRPMHSDVRGFTIIELLIVVVIIGILAAIAIPKFANTKEKAYVASMRADLRNLATAQEGYLHDFMTYAVQADMGPPRFQTSSGVLITISGVTAAGWQGVAKHTGSATRVCAIFYGSAAVPIAPATDEGEVRCN